MTRKTAIRTAIATYVGTVIILSAAAIYFTHKPPSLEEANNEYFPNVLVWAEPDPWDGNEFVGFTRADADTLQEKDYWKSFRKELTFAPADTPSQNNLTVSVNPIDRWTWSATALSSNGQCYATLIAHDPVDVNMGSTFYSVFPESTPCVAVYATREVVNTPTAPD